MGMNMSFRIRIKSLLFIIVTIASYFLSGCSIVSAIFGFIYLRIVDCGIDFESELDSDSISIIGLAWIFLILIMIFSFNALYCTGTTGIFSFYTMYDAMFSFYFGFYKEVLSLFYNLIIVYVLGGVIYIIE